MPTVEEVTDPMAVNLTPPPPADEGTCDVCRSWTEKTWPGYATRCESCRRTTSGVAHPVELVVPISLATVGTQYYSTLSGYKNSPADSARAEYALRLGALLARFLRDHGDHLRATAGRAWDAMTIVPSSSGRAGPHPLEGVVLKARAHHALYKRLLEAGGAQLSHRASADGGYKVIADVAGRHVLIVDDTFTTGARVQSAASALTLAGADVVGAVTLGRIVRPDYADEAREMWDRQRAVPFDFGICCLE